MVNWNVHKMLQPHLEREDQHQYILQLRLVDTIFEVFFQDRQGCVQVVLFFDSSGKSPLEAILYLIYIMSSCFTWSSLCKAPNLTDLCRICLTFTFSELILFSSSIFILISNRDKVTTSRYHKMRQLSFQNSFINYKKKAKSCTQWPIRVKLLYWRPQRSDQKQK